MSIRLTDTARTTLATAISVGRLTGTGAADLGGHAYARSVARLLDLGFLAHVGGDLYTVTDTGAAYAAAHRIA